jgi:hypothetical protein
MPGLLLALGLAAATPKLIYRPDPARPADVATVELQMPHHPCFGWVTVSVLLSSGKSDRSRVYALSVTLADSPFPPHIDGAAAAGQPLRLINVRDGDVACTEYQCQSGSSAVFAIDEAQRAAVAAGAWPVRISTTAGSQCDVPVTVDPAVLTALEGWAAKLAPRAGG